MGFKKYLENLPYLRPPEEISSSEGEEHEEGLNDEATVTMAQLVGKGESDALEEDSNEAPLSVPCHSKEKGEG